MLVNYLILFIVVYPPLMLFSSIAVWDFVIPNTPKGNSKEDWLIRRARARWAITAPLWIPLSPLFWFAIGCGKLAVGVRSVVRMALWHPAKEDPPESSGPYR